MKVIAPDTEMLPDLQAEFREVCERISKGIPFTREEKEKAAAEIDRMREENLKLFGVQDVVVDIIREMRNGRG